MILLDIGNTHTRIARADGSVVRLLTVVPTAELSAALLPPGEIAAASVCPRADRRLSSRKIKFISAADCGKLVDFSQVDTTTLGADRVANAVAASVFYKLPALVVDCGSAITCELVDAERRFSGGAIAPGRRLMRMALHSGTARLPEVELGDSVVNYPGRNTVDAIKFGVDAGALGIVAELHSMLDRKYDLKSVILTGGDRKFFAERFSGWIVAPPDFTLHGVRLAAGG